VGQADEELAATFEQTTGRAARTPWRGATSLHGVLTALSSIAHGNVPALPCSAVSCSGRMPSPAASSRSCAGTLACDRAPAGSCALPSVRAHDARRVRGPCPLGRAVRGGGESQSTLPPAVSVAAVPEDERGYSPSLTALAHVRRRSRQAELPHTIAFVRHSDGPGAEPLPNTLVETDLVTIWFDEHARVISDGSMTSKEVVLDSLRGRDIWHFACHGEFDLNVPLRS
jgi:hypothetical protein